MFLYKVNHDIVIGNVYTKVKQSWWATLMLVCCRHNTVGLEDSDDEVSSHTCRCNCKHVYIFNKKCTVYSKSFVFKTNS